MELVVFNALEPRTEATAIVIPNLCFSAKVQSGTMREATQIDDLFSPWAIGE